MMDELIGNVAEKTGLSPEQAKAAVETVLGTLQAKIPAPLSGLIASYTGGGEIGAAAGGEGLVGKAKEALGSFFGKES